MRRRGVGERPARGRLRLHDPVAALGHLRREGVGPGDLFLFFAQPPEDQVQGRRPGRIGNAERIRVVDRRGREHDARVARRDAANDLALLRIDARVDDVLPLSRGGELRKGEQVLTVGYPLVEIQGEDPKATFGRINSVEGLGGDARFYQIDVPVQPGSSGSPLVDARGQVVGVVSATLDQLRALRTSGSLPQNVNYAIKSTVLLPLLLLEVPMGELPVVTDAREVPVLELVEKVERSLIRVRGREGGRVSSRTSGSVVPRNSVGGLSLAGGDQAAPAY